MCSKASFIAAVISEMLVHYEDEQLERLKKKLFYTAPELCNHQWSVLYDYVKEVYKEDQTICNIYNEGYKKYIKHFVTIYN